MKIHIERRLYPHFRITPEEDLLLGILQKEISISQCLSELEDFGVDTSRWPIDLGTITLSLFGFTNPDDETVTWYYEKLSEYAERLKEDDSNKSELTIEFYHALTQRHQESHQTTKD